MAGPVDRQSPPSRAVRDAAIDTLAAAYGDGQLSLEEYDERVAGVQSADNAWRLERWIDDLQPPPPPPPTWRERTGVAAFRRGARGWWDDVRADWARYPRGARVAIAAVALAVTGTLLGSVAYEALRDDSSVVVRQGASTGLGDFRAAYAAEFETTLIGSLQIDPGYVRVEVPVETDPPRFQSWALQDGSFSSAGQVRGGRPDVVDLAEIDVDAVDEALERGVEELGVPGVSTVTTIISATGTGSHERITLVLRNEFEETARLVTDFAGRELSRQPFVGPGEG